MGAASYKRRANKNITAIPIDTLVGYLLLSTGYLSNQISTGILDGEKTQPESNSESCQFARQKFLGVDSLEAAKPLDVESTVVQV